MWNWTSLKGRKQKNIVIVYIGDGTLGQGLLYEALNYSGVQKLPICFVCEDNEIAQSTPTKLTRSGDLSMRVRGFGVDYTEIDNIVEESSRLNLIFEKARRCEPQFLRIVSKRLKSHSKGDDNRDESYLAKIKSEDQFLLDGDFQKKLEIKKSQFVKEGVRLSGEHVVPERILEKSNQIPNLKWSINTDPNRYVSQINSALRGFLLNHERSLMVGEDIRDKTVYPCDVVDYGGAFKVTRGLSTLFGERVMNFPISEQLLVGFSTGFSMVRGAVICEIMFADFLTLTVDQVFQHLTKFYHMLGNKHKPKVIIRTPSGGYRGYGPTHSQCLEWLFVGIPNFNVLAANKYISPSQYFEYMFLADDSFLFVENKIMYTEKSIYYEKSHKLSLINMSLSVPVVFLQSKYLTANVGIVTYGQMLSLAEIVASDLAHEEEIGANVFCLSDLNQSLTDLSSHIDDTIKVLVVLVESQVLNPWTARVMRDLWAKNLKLIIIGNDSIIPASSTQEAETLPSVNSIKTRILNEL